MRIFFGRKISFLFLVMILMAGCTSKMEPSSDFGAYYTKIDSGEEFEKYSRTGGHADIIVYLGRDNGKFVFWRGSSYLPYWEPSAGKIRYVDEIIPRHGDGSGIRPDKTNTYSVVKIIESHPQRVVVHWRYLPEFGGSNPHTGVDATKFVDEYFNMTPDGKVIRTIRKGTEKIDEWNDPLNKITQTFSLTSRGVTGIKLTQPGQADPPAPVEGSKVITELVSDPVA